MSATGPIVATVTGVVLGVGVAFGAVTSQTANPSPVDEPYVVYGPQASPSPESTPAESPEESPSS